MENEPPFQMNFRFHTLMVLLLVATLATWGYNFGRADQSEVIPYALFLAGKWTDSIPLFIQNLQVYFPNERFAISCLLAPFADYLPVVTLLFHLITTYFLMIGMFKISKLYLEESLAFVVLWLMMLPLWGVNFGGNELYYNNFQASTISKCFGIWGLYFFLTQRLNFSFLFFTIATLFHILAGIQIGFLCLAVYFIHSLMNHKSFPKIYFSMILFIAFSISYILLTKINLNKGQKILSDEMYFIAMFQWKYTEHYDILHFPISGYAMYIVSLASIFTFFRNNPFIKILTVLHILGVMVYLIGFYLLQSHSIVFLQWFKTTIWIKLLGVIGLLALSQKIISRLSFNIWLNKFQPILYGLWLLILYKFNRITLALGSISIILGTFKNHISDKIVILILVLITFAGTLYRHNRIPLDIPGFEDNKILFCKEIAKMPDSMTVITPIDFTELESYTQKNAYLNFIATPKENAFFAEYLTRLEEIYGLKPHKYPIKKELDKAKAFYNQKEWAYWQKFKAKGVNYIITENKKFDGMKPVLAVEEWYLWKLN